MSKNTNSKIIKENDSVPAEDGPADGGDTPDLNLDSGVQKTPFSKISNIPETMKVTKLESKLLRNGKFDSYMLLPTQISDIWNSSRVRENIVGFL